MTTSSPIVGIACSVFSPAIKQLENAGDISFPIYYLDSMLHMHPNKLGVELNTLIAQLREKDKMILLLYGDCFAKMFQIDHQEHIARLDGGNCIEILFGQKRYKTIQKNKSFVLMKEWLDRWEEVFTQGLGFNRETAQMFMPEHHSELLYVDCGQNPPPIEILDACADFCGLPWRPEIVSLESFKVSIAAALKQLEKGK